jgi:hypothetical protein
MTTPPLSLKDLAQHIAQQESELDRLRREFEDRREQLDELTRRKADLEAQLRDVEAEIEGLAPSGPETAPAPKAAEPVSTRARAGRGMTLSDLIVSLVGEGGGRPVTVKQLAREVVRRKFPTTSNNIPGLVQTRVGELVRKGFLRRAGNRHGVLPGKSTNGQAAPRRAKGPARGKRRKPAARPSREKAPSPRGEQPALREMITQVLKKSRQPLGSGQLAEKILATGYKTSSKDFAGVVSVALTKMPNLEKVPGRGFRIKKGAD